MSDLSQSTCLSQTRSDFRHLHVSDGPSIADPAGIVVIAETDNSPRVEGVVAPYVGWTGWRARLVRWVINFLLPRPERHWNGVACVFKHPSIRRK